MSEQRDPSSDDVEVQEDEEPDVNLYNIQFEAINPIRTIQKYSVSIDDIPLKIEKYTLCSLMTKMFNRNEDILRIAAGIAMVKGNNIITEEDIGQAFAVEQKGATKSLPKPLDWNSRPRAGPSQ